MYNVNGKILHYQQTQCTISAKTVCNICRNSFHCYQKRCTISTETMYNVNREHVQCQQTYCAMSADILCNVRRNIVQCQQTYCAMSAEILCNVSRHIVQCQQTYCAMSVRANDNIRAKTVIYVNQGNSNVYFRRPLQNLIDLSWTPSIHTTVHLELLYGPQGVYVDHCEKPCCKWMIDNISES